MSRSAQRDSLQVRLRRAIRRLMRRMLELEDYTLLEARNGEEALELAHSYGKELHLLVTDVVMPGLSGFDLADELLVSRSEMKMLSSRVKVIIPPCVIVFARRSVLSCSSPTPKRSWPTLFVPRSNVA